MAILTILHYPDPQLHKIAQPVQRIDDTIVRLVEDMAETMHAAPGIGLAATQVNVHKQIIVIDISEEKNQLLTLINPRIIASSGIQDSEEGCLSVPGIYERVKRAEKITVQALDRAGNKFTLDAEGLLAVCIQHEMDHLIGKVFVEYLSPLKQIRIKHKMKKRLRETM
jgi:peptide deformylase